MRAAALVILLIAVAIAVAVFSSDRHGPKAGQPEAPTTTTAVVERPQSDYIGPDTNLP